MILLASSVDTPVCNSRFRLRLRVQCGRGVRPTHLVALLGSVVRQQVVPQRLVHLHRGLDHTAERSALQTEHNKLLFFACSMNGRLGHAHLLLQRFPGPVHTGRRSPPKRYTRYDGTCCWLQEYSHSKQARSKGLPAKFTCESASMSFCVKFSVREILFLWGFWQVV